MTAPGGSTFQTQALARTASDPSLVESVLGRLIELVVFSVEGLRERLQRPAVQ